MPTHNLYPPVGYFCVVPILPRSLYHVHEQRYSTWNHALSLVMHMLFIPCKYVKFKLHLKILTDAMLQIYPGTLYISVLSFVESFVTCFIRMFR